MKLKAGSLRISIKLINLLPNMGIITKVHRRMKKLEPQFSGQRVKRGASEKQKVSGRSQRRRNWGEQSHKVVYELQGSPTYTWIWPYSQKQRPRKLNNGYTAQGPDSLLTGWHISRTDPNRTTKVLKTELILEPQPTDRVGTYSLNLTRFAKTKLTLSTGLKYSRV